LEADCRHLQSATGTHKRPDETSIRTTSLPRISGFLFDSLDITSYMRQMLDLAILGREIAHRRSAAGLTQAIVASRARIGRSTLDALENGRTAELGFGKIVRILASLGLDLQVIEARRLRPTLEDLQGEDD
jgi:DNA-binding XRE family transcriptional regulator